MVKLIVLNIVIILLFALGCSSTFIDDDNELPLYAPGIRIINYEPDILSNRTKRTPASAATLCTGAFGVKCDADCSTMVYCNGPVLPPNEYTCESTDASKPFCVNDACTAAPDLSNVMCKSSYLCTSVGTFPDPFDCTKFHNCVDVIKPAESYVCPPTYTYISTNKICTRTNTCQKFTCPKSGTGTGTTAFAYDKAYYGYCFQKPDGPKTVLMYKCENEIDYIYDDKIGKCIFNCKSSANYIDRENCNNYISCYMENAVHKSKVLPCPVGHYFDSTKSTCKPGKCTN